MSLNELYFPIEKYGELFPFYDYFAECKKGVK